MVSHVPCYLPSPFNMLVTNVPFFIPMRHYSTVISRFVSTSPFSPRSSRSTQSIQLPWFEGDDIVHTRTHSQDPGDESDATRLSQREVMARTLLTTWGAKGGGGS